MATGLTSGGECERSSLQGTNFFLHESKKEMMKNHSLTIYEDAGWKNLLPLVYTRAVFQLVCGMGDLLTKVQLLVTAC